MSDMDKVIVTHITDFLKSIGIMVQHTQLDDRTFLPGLSLMGQRILMDEGKLKYPGDLLHEAGHIVVTEPHLRPMIGSEDMPKEWPSQGDEIAAILWSYAALHYLNLKPEVVFHEYGYRGASSWFIEQFTNGIYMGLPLLNWMGFCNDPADFPKLKQWLR